MAAAMAARRKPSPAKAENAGEVIVQTSGQLRSSNNRAPPAATKASAFRR